MARNIRYAARIISRNAPTLNEAIHKQAEQENYTAVVEQEGRAARKPSQKEPRWRRPLLPLAQIAHWIPHCHKSHKNQVAEHEVVVQIACAEEDWRSKGVE